MISHLGEKGAAILRAVRHDFEQLEELSKSSPDDAEIVARAIVMHLRSRFPLTLQGFDDAAG